MTALLEASPAPCPPHIGARCGSAPGNAADTCAGTAI